MPSAVHSACSHNCQGCVWIKDSLFNLLATLPQPSPHEAVFQINSKNHVLYLQYLFLEMLFCMPATFPALCWCSNNSCLLSEKYLSLANAFYSKTSIFLVLSQSYVVKHISSCHIPKELLGISVKLEFNDFSSYYCPCLQDCNLLQIFFFIYMRRNVTNRYLSIHMFLFWFLCCISAVFLFQLHSLYETAFLCTRFNCFYFNTLINSIMCFCTLERVSKSDHPV